MSEPLKDKHPLDSARENLLNSVRGGKRSVLASKLQNVRTERDDAAQAAFIRIQREQGARSMRTSSATIEQCFNAVQALADRSFDAAARACLEIGAKPEAAIAEFLRIDLEHFLQAFLRSRFGSFGISMAHYEASATALASRSADRLRSLTFDFERDRPHALERLTKAALRKPLIAWIVLVYGVMSSLLGTYAGIRAIRGDHGAANGSAATSQERAK